MTKAQEKVLREWLDPETGGTMPADCRAAGLAALEELDKLRELLVEQKLLTASYVTDLGQMTRERDEARALAVAKEKS
jgi:hypothetical protein